MRYLQFSFDFVRQQLGPGFGIAEAVDQLGFREQMAQVDIVDGVGEVVGVVGFDQEVGEVAAHQRFIGHQNSCGEVR